MYEEGEGFTEGTQLDSDETQPRNIMETTDTTQHDNGNNSMMHVTRDLKRWLGHMVNTN